jgi:hypothetical protein
MNMLQKIFVHIQISNKAWLCEYHPSFLHNGFTRRSAKREQMEHILVESALSVTGGMIYFVCIRLCQSLLLDMKLGCVLLWGLHC